jgi:hypothetical protein
MFQLAEMEVEDEMGKVLKDEFEVEYIKEAGTKQEVCVLYIYIYIYIWIYIYFFPLFFFLLLLLLLLLFFIYNCRDVGSSTLFWRRNSQLVPVLSIIFCISIQKI